MYGRRAYVKRIAGKRLNYGWRLLSESQETKQYLVVFGDLENQAVLIDVKYSKAVTPRVTVDLIGNSRINYDLIEDLEKVIGQSESFYLFRNGRPLRIP